MSKKIIALGAGKTACLLVEKCRKLDEDATISIVSEETYLSYQRPPLSRNM